MNFAVGLDLHGPDFIGVKVFLTNAKSKGEAFFKAVDEVKAPGVSIHGWDIAYDYDYLRSVASRAYYNSTPSSRLKAIKAVREVSGMSLKEAKNFVFDEFPD